MTEKTALDCCYDWETKTPDRIWLTQPLGGGQVRTFTWRQALDEARRMAAHLRSLALPPGSHIALFSKNSAWWVLADLAIWMAGHVSVPLFATLTPTSIRQILEHSESVLIFIGKLDGFAEMEPGIPEGLPRIRLPLAPDTAGERWEEIIARTPPLEGQVRRELDELATIIYTSGSTGVPKGAMHSFATLSRPARGIIALLGIRDDDRMLSYLPLAHVFERWIGEVTTLTGGYQLFFAESLETFQQDLQRARPTLFISVPRLWLKFQAGVYKKMPPAKLARLLKIPLLNRIVRKKILTALGLDQIRFAGSGSAPIPAELIAWYRGLGLELLEGYGMTENLCYSHLSRPGQVRPGYVGQPYPDVQQRISPEGEVQLRGPGNMLGYYKNPELTQEAFTEDGWLRTGDRGEIDEIGRLKLTGRLKEQFKTSKGKYVVPAPIENKLLLHQEIEQAVVSGSGMEAAYALVLPSETVRAELRQDPGAKERLGARLEEIRREVNGGLDHHEQLQFLAVTNDEWTIESGILTPTMKIKRQAIEGRYGEQVPSWYATRQTIVWL
ncbi:MAG: AMP-binding protein [Myxococcota bacterium]|jgi:long-subunit acyl-CoA synthetase (AMP-forming)|nr:AMP-binding protein [Myxococcota bacterium]